MQNKGLIKFFAILFAVVSIYQLSFTFVSNKIQDDAKAFAGGDSEKELAYLDSIGKVEVYPVLGYTYNEVRDKQINKGLDLEGGINVILEISVKDILKGLANNSKNPVFNRALERATKEREGNQVKGARTLNRSRVFSTPLLQLHVHIALILEKNLKQR